MKKTVCALLALTAVFALLLHAQSFALDLPDLPVDGGGERKAGDVNTDGAVNNKDVVALFRYVSGVKPAKFDEKAGDCNGDGAINNKDVVLLFRYVSGQNVTIKYGKN
ncbi:MAG: dockerin type I repeat-containing protein [Clostridia bacterium]|nr:dockerin type I repeat-containing protein [Clostridia bacterium]